MLNFHIVFVNFMQIHNCEAAYYVLKQNHNGHVITDSLLLNTLTSRIRYQISFAPSALCHLIQRIWPLHLTRIPPPFLISLSQLRLSHRLWFDAHMLPDRPGPVNDGYI